MTRNNADFQGVNYRFWDKSKSAIAHATPGNHVLHAYDQNDSLIGRLTWDGERNGEITHWSVHPDWQSKGVGTALLAKAAQIASTRGLIQPEHSATRTDAGDAAAKKTAEKLSMKVPERKEDSRLGQPVGYFTKPNIDEDGTIQSSNHDVIRASIVELARRNTPIYRG